MKKNFPYQKLQKFDNYATQWLIRNEYFVAGTPARDDKPATQGYFTEKENTKLSENMRKCVKNWNKIYEEYVSKIDDLQLDHCAVDQKSKVILKDENGNRSYTPDKEKELKKAIKDLSNEEVAIDVRITEGDWKLSDDEKEAFSGIIIPEINSDEED